MPVFPAGSSSPDPRARRLATTLYAYTFVDELILLYPVYALLFAHTGLSVAQISSLFAIWSVAGFVLEIPSGMWADAVSRRLLLCLGPLLSAVGYALWTAVPCYWAFAAGFVLWGAQGALQSGATEALVYEELDRYGAADRYARIMGRAQTAGLVAMMAATAIAGPVFAAGGYLAVGVASVAARLGCAAIAMTLPERRTRDRAGAVAVTGPPGTLAAEPGYFSALRCGLREARTDRSVRRALLLIPAVTAVWGALEEYDPLLAEGTGVAAGTVPLLVLLVSVGIAAGGLLAAAGQRMTARAFAAAVGLGGVALATGALSGRPAGFLLIGAAFGVFQMAGVVADARLQARITGAGRATVTSLAGLGTELVTLLAFGGYAVASRLTGQGTVFALFALPYLAVAVVLARGGGGGRGRDPRREPVRVGSTR
jgi:MFS family permease